MNCGIKMKRLSLDLMTPSREIHLNKGICRRVLFFGDRLSTPEASGPRSGPPGREKAEGLFPLRAKPAPIGNDETLGKRRQIESGREEERGNDRRHKLSDEL
jgi:hypothetical protein